MTNCMDRVTRNRTRIRYSIAVTMLSVSAGCAGLPAFHDEVRHVLDERTGVTIARLEQPLELTVSASTGPANDPFAYLGPFQTNRMGERADYLWLAVPAAGTLAGSPIVRADGEVVRMGEMSAAPDAAHLERSPYKAPTPWSQQFVAVVESAAIEQLATARRIEIATRDAAGDWTFALQGDALSALRRYADGR